jgi:DNA-binding Lrp family transcriptional regulator
VTLSQEEQIIPFSSIDALDADLIALLVAEPRIGAVEAARRLGVARGTVNQRLRRLEADGVLEPTGAVIDAAALGYSILTFLFLEIVQGRLAEATASLEAVPEVLEAHAITGPRDLLARVVARDTEDLQRVINLIVRAPSIRRSTSHIALSTPVRRRDVPLVRQAARPGAGRARPFGVG